MSSARLARSRIVLAAVLLGTGGCAAVAQSVAEAFVRDGGPPSSGAQRPDDGIERTPPMREASRSEERAPSTTYQAGATIDWTLYRFGAPYSISNALFERERTVGQACRPAPFGLGRGFARDSDARENLFGEGGAGASVSRPIANADRYERDLLDNSLRLTTLFATDDNGLAAHYVASAARLGHQGHPCNGSLFAFVWVWGGEATVTIHR